VCPYVAGFIVDAKYASEAIFHGQVLSVSRQDERIERQKMRRFVERQSAKLVISNRLPSYGHPGEIVIVLTGETMAMLCLSL